MTKSKVREMVSDFVAYAGTELPLRIAAANDGELITAPALKKIEKTIRVNAQYFPCAAINLESVDFEEAGPGALRIEARIDLAIFAADSRPERLSDFLDRYLDSAVDLASDDDMGASDWNIRVESADKGCEPDGTRGWVAVRFVLFGEVVFREE